MYITHHHQWLITVAYNTVTRFTDNYYICKLEALQHVKSCKHKTTATRKQINFATQALCKKHSSIPAEAVAYACIHLLPGIFPSCVHQHTVLQLPK